MRASTTEWFNPCLPGQLADVHLTLLNKSPQHPDPALGAEHVLQEIVLGELNHHKATRRIREFNVNADNSYREMSKSSIPEYWNQTTVQ
jgi:hypothetical protein